MKMTHKEDIEYLKKYHPMEYDAYFSDPVTGNSGGDNDGCLTLIIVFIIVIIFTLGFFFGAKN